MTDCVRCCWQKYEQERDLGSHRLKYCQRFIIGRINGPGIPCISFVSVPCSTCHPFLSLLPDKDSATLRPKKHRPLRSPSEISWRKTKVARPRKKKREIHFGPHRKEWLLIRGIARKRAFFLIPPRRNLIYIHCSAGGEESRVDSLFNIEIPLVPTNRDVRTKGTNCSLVP